MEHTNEMSGMAKKVGDVEAMLKFVVKEQNLDLYEEDK